MGVWVSGASKWANGGTNGPVLCTSISYAFYPMWIEARLPACTIMFICISPHVEMFLCLIAITLLTIQWSSSITESDNSGEIKSRLMMGLLGNLLFSICAEAESHMIRQSWLLFNFGAVTQPLAIIFVKMAYVWRQHVEQVDLNISQGRVIIICSWELIFQIIGISRILCLPDRSLQELHFEFLCSIVAQSDQKIWKFTSTFWCGLMPFFPTLQIWISDQSISKWHISWTNKATEPSKSRAHSPFHTMF